MRFTPNEAAKFLNQGMGLNLSAEDITRLETRTEGWIAGLQMAALSMQGRTDTANFIQTFTGDHHFILDYLAEEVLQQQSESVQTFLLQTSILERLSNSLCDAVTSMENSREMLESLEHANLFVIPLDDKRHWYRYHHLFADVLQARLMKEQSNQVSNLHKKASVWFEQNDLPHDAIRHALAAEDFERAAGLIELVWRAMDRTFQLNTWFNWVKVLPDVLIQVRPVLSVGYAWALLNDGKFDASEVRLRDAEQWLDTTDTGKQSRSSSLEMVVVDKAEFYSLPVTIASARAYTAQALGDVPATIKHASRALKLLPKDDHLGRAIPLSLLGLAHWISGDLEAAYQSLAEGMSGFEKTGKIMAAITGTFGLADMRITQGRLYEAVHLYEQALQLALKQNELILQGTAIIYLGLSELHREQHNLGVAEKYLQKSEELSKQDNQEIYKYRRCLTLARVKELEGNMDGAFKLLSEAEQFVKQIHIPNLRPVAALKTQLWIKQGKLNKAQAWVRELGLSVNDELSYLHEFEHITLARLLIAQYKNMQEEHTIHEAIGLLKRLLKAAEEGKRTGSVIEILILQTLALEAQANIPAALEPLQKALTLAEPEDYVQIFVDEGLPMAQLLSKVVAQRILPNYVTKLQASFETEKQGIDQPSPLPLPTSSPNQSLSELLVEPLSNCN